MHERKTILKVKVLVRLVTEPHENIEKPLE